MLTYRFDPLSQTNYPTFSRLTAPNRQEALALAQIAASIGVTRVGLVYTANTYGQDMRAGFITECAARNISVVASASVPRLRELSETLKANAISDFEQAVRTAFHRENVKVYLFALDVADINHGLPALQRASVVGKGHTILLPSTHTLFMSLGTLAQASLQAQYDQQKAWLHGSIGIYPVTSSTAFNTMAASYPGSAGLWSALLNTSNQTASLTSLPLPDTSQYFGLWGTLVWDGTLFLGKAIGAAYKTCALSASGHPEVLCLIDSIRNATLNGTTGEIVLDTKGDREGRYGVYNVVNGTKALVGSVSPTIGARINIPSILWSDNSTNRQTSPAWGQAPHPATPSPTVAAPSVLHSKDKTTVLSLSVAVGGLFILVAVAYASHHQYQKHKKLQPTNFKKVKQCLFLLNVFPV